METPIVVMLCISCLTSFVIILAIARFVKFFDEFVKFKSRNDVELNNAIWHLKKSEETREKILIEVQRLNKLLYDLYKGKRIDPFSEVVEYKQEDVLRHTKANEAFVSTATGSLKKVPSPEANSQENETTGNDTRVMAAVAGK
ncbi:MAG: hypothetical protein PHQ27_11235 [Victivallales bacterium]|nr:hypothetical protein [Victivallales bacterium]